MVRNMALMELYIQNLQRLVSHNLELIILRLLCYNTILKQYQYIVLRLYQL